MNKDDASAVALQRPTDFFYPRGNCLPEGSRFLAQLTGNCALLGGHCRHLDRGLFVSQPDHHHPRRHDYWYKTAGPVCTHPRWRPRRVIQKTVGSMDWVCEWLLNRPFTDEKIDNYRKYHVVHHANTQQENDPDLSAFETVSHHQELLSAQSDPRPHWTNRLGSIRTHRQGCLQGRYAG